MAFYEFIRHLAKNVPISLGELANRIECSEARLCPGMIKILGARRSDADKLAAALNVPQELITAACEIDSLLSAKTDNEFIRGFTTATKFSQYNLEILLKPDAGT